MQHRIRVSARIRRHPQPRARGKLADHSLGQYRLSAIRLGMRGKDRHSERLHPNRQMGRRAQRVVAAAGEPQQGKCNGQTSKLAHDSSYRATVANGLQQILGAPSPESGTWESKSLSAHPFRVLCEKGRISTVFIAFYSSFLFPIPYSLFPIPYSLFFYTHAVASIPSFTADSFNPSARSLK